MGESAHSVGEMLGGGICAGGVDRGYHCAVIQGRG